MSDLIVSREREIEEDWGRPPLFLQSYLDERERSVFEERVVKPPGARMQACVVERRDNVIVLEFREMPSVPRKRRVGMLRHLCRNGWDASMLLLLLASAAACVAAFSR